MEGVMKPILKEDRVALHKQEKEEIVKRFQKKELDTGSSGVQVALLSYRIARLTEHFKTNKLDHHGRRGLMKMVNKRRRLLDYMKRKNLEEYNQLINELGLRK